MKKINIEDVVIANVKIKYQNVSTAPAIAIKYILKNNSFFKDMNCEYTAINQTNIFGFKIAILKPFKNEIVISFVSFFLNFNSSLFKIVFNPRK